MAIKVLSIDKMILLLAVASIGIIMSCSHNSTVLPQMLIYPYNINKLEHFFDQDTSRNGDSWPHL